MNEEEQIAYIVHHLTEYDDPKELIFDLCEKSGLTWPQAEALVQRVQEEKQGEISRKQFPLMFGLALAIFLAGLGLMGYSVFFCIRPLVEGRTGSPTDVSNYFLYLANVIVESRGMVIYEFIFGLAMILGSLIGMRDVWTNILIK